MISFGEGNGTPLQYSCLENPIDGGAWWAAVHGVAKSRTRLSDFTFTFHFHALEKEMAIHSRVLAWRIPGTGKPGRLPSMGLHRVVHDWSDSAAAAAVEKTRDSLEKWLIHGLEQKRPSLLGSRQEEAGCSGWVYQGPRANLRVPAGQRGTRSSQRDSSWNTLYDHACSDQTMLKATWPHPGPPLEDFRGKTHYCFENARLDES